jgi:hypothetical protein
MEAIAVLPCAKSAGGVSTPGKNPHGIDLGIRHDWTVRKQARSTMKGLLMSSALVTRQQFSCRIFKRRCAVKPDRAIFSSSGIRTARLLSDVDRDRPELLC